MRAAFLADARKGGLLLREAEKKKPHNIRAKPTPRPVLRPTTGQPMVDALAAAAFAQDPFVYDLYQAILEEYELAYAERAAHLDLDLGSPVPTDAMDALYTYADQFGGAIVADEKRSLLDLIGQAIDQGLGPDLLAKAITAHFDQGIHRLNSAGQVTYVQPIDQWAHTVARTELSRAYNLGAKQLYTDAGLKEWRWTSALDPRVCPACEAADGEVVQIGQPFGSVGVEQAPAHPGCLCTCVADPTAMKALDDAHTARARAATGNQPFYGGS